MGIANARVDFYRNPYTGELLGGGIVIAKNAKGGRVRFYIGASGKCETSERISANHRNSGGRVAAASIAAAEEEYRIRYASAPKFAPPILPPTPIE